MNRKGLWAICAAAMCLTLSFYSAMAEEYPNRPISLVVPFSAGGTVDIVARKLSEKVSESLGQPLICLNRTGGGGSVALAEVLRSKPDGYTIGCVNMPALAIIPHMQKVPYDPLKDIAHIGVVMPFEYGLYVIGNSPWNSLKDMVEYARNNPGKVTYAAGTGTTNHLIMVRIGQENNLKWKQVPYNGDPEAVTAILGGHVNAGVMSTGQVPQVKAGKLKLLVVTSKDRWAYLPEVPTLLESGYKYFQSSYFSLGVPAATPLAIRGKLEDHFRKVIGNSALKEELQQKYFVKLEYMSGEEYARYINGQFAFYKEFLKEQKIKP